MYQVLRELESLGLTRTDEINREAVARFCAPHAGQSPATLKGLLAYLRAAVNLGIESGYLERSPFHGRFKFVKRGRKPPKKTHHAAHEIERVLRALNARTLDWKSHRLFGLISTLAYTGMRRNEALYLKIRNLNFDDGLISIEPSAANPLKTEGSAAEVPAPAVLLATLQEWARRSGSEWLFPKRNGSGPWINGSGRDKPTEAVKRAGEAVGVDGFTPLSLRHSFASIAVGWGYTPLQIQQCLRHTNSRTQEAYRHAEIVELARKFASVSFTPKEEPPTWPPNDRFPRVRRHG